MKPKSLSHIAEVTIDSVGHKGDGVAAHEGRALYVPFTVAGDRARAKIDGDQGLVLDIVAPGADRAAPHCRHFGECGGCVLQHMAPPAYAAWKRAQVVNALAQRGLGGITVDEAVILPPHSRRRVVLKALRTGQGVVLGFNRRASHQLIDIGECVIASPAIEALIEPLRFVFSETLHPKEWAKIAVTETDSGLDCACESETQLKLPALERLVAFAERYDLARIAWNGDPVAARRAPFIAFDGIAVTLPPKHFLQASRAADQILTDRVRNFIGTPRRVADLFCGLGTFSIPLSRTARVKGFDSEEASLSALQSARRANNLPIETERRDLFRRPLSAKECNAFDAVVFDPPRAGALEQCQALAESDVQRIVAVSCNPASFARDARVLIDGGYRLERVTPVDQFLWSAHVELVALFSR